MSYAQIKAIVIGGLNTDIIGLGVNEIIGPSELTLGGELLIGPGGKSRNIAQMIATYLGKDSTAMIGRSCRDPYSIWEAPVKALQEAGVNTDFIKVLNYTETKRFPGVALIPVDKQGRNQIYVLPGVNDDFCAADIDEAEDLFTTVGNNNGVLAFSLELPLPTAIHALKKAAKKNIKVILDPGGIDKNTDYTELLQQKIFLLKPNEHEAKILTGVDVTDFASAKKAAEELFNLGIENVLITHGEKGAYLFAKDFAQHIPIPQITEIEIKDETGCGDQVAAVVAAEIASGSDLLSSAQTAIKAGTLQFYRVGIQPVKRQDITK
jgi:ribokinase